MLRALVDIINTAERATPDPNVQALIILVQLGVLGACTMTCAILFWMVG